MHAITLLGLAMVFFYSLIQIFAFYGISEDVYGVYLLFYIFIIISLFILPNDYPKV
jgi:hypothetical protein